MRKENSEQPSKENTCQYQVESYSPTFLLPRWGADPAWNPLEGAVPRRYQPGGAAQCGSLRLEPPAPPAPAPPPRALPAVRPNRRPWHEAPGGRRAPGSRREGRAGRAASRPWQPRRRGRSRLPGAGPVAMAATWPPPRAHRPGGRCSPRRAGLRTGDGGAEAARSGRGGAPGQRSALRRGAGSRARGESAPSSCRSRAGIAIDAQRRKDLRSAR